MTRINIFLIACAIVTVNGDFPDNPKPCKYENFKCIVNLMNQQLSEKGKVGDGSIGLVKVDPFLIDTLRIKNGGNSPINIDLRFTNNEMHGLSAARVKSVKGFGKDINGNFELRLHVPVVSLIGPYTINGKVLILPISGQGTSNMTFVNNEVTISFTGKAVERNGEMYMEPSNIKLTNKSTRIIYNFENLFNGDKALGDGMNSFLNENWKTIIDELSHPVYDGIAKKVYRTIIAKVFSKYPYAKFFAE